MTTILTSASILEVAVAVVAVAVESQEHRALVLWNRTAGPIKDSCK